MSGEDIAPERRQPAPDAERPGGGHPIRVVGGTWWLENLCSAGLAVGGDHADLARILVAAIDHLLTDQHRAGVVLGTGRGVLAGKRGEGADRAERDNEEAKGGFQHRRGPRWRLVNDWFTGQFFPVDVVNCFIGFVASISWTPAQCGFRGQNHV